MKRPMTTEPLPSQHLEQKLRAVLRGTAATTGDAFFQSLTRHLAEGLGVAFAFVAESTDGTRTHARTLAFWGHDRHRENVEYAVAGTPCEIVMRDEAVFYGDGVQDQFAGDELLVALGVRSYFAIPVRNPQGHVIGHVGAMDTGPMTMDMHKDWLLEVFASRTGPSLRGKRPRLRPASWRPSYSRPRSLMGSVSSRPEPRTI